jgi:hypothetical protein
VISQVAPVRPCSRAIVGSALYSMLASSEATTSATNRTARTRPKRAPPASDVGNLVPPRNAAGQPAAARPARFDQRFR